MPSFHANAKEAAELVQSAWNTDCQEMADMILSWIPEGWQAQRDVLLKEEGAAMREKLLANSHYSQLTKAVDLLEEWKRLMRQLSNDGGGMGSLELETSKQMAHALLNGRETLQIIYALYVILKVTGAMDNRKQRMQQATKYESELSNVALGLSLKERLKELKAGKVPEVPAPPAAPSVDGSDGVDAPNLGS